MSLFLVSGDLASEGQFDDVREALGSSDATARARGVVVEGLCDRAGVATTDEGGQEASGGAVGDGNSVRTEVC